MSNQGKRKKKIDSAGCFCDVVLCIISNTCSLQIVQYQVKKKKSEKKKTTKLNSTVQVLNNNKTKFK